MSKDIIDRNNRSSGPRYVRKNSCSSSNSLANSSPVTEHISETVLKIWNQLPESIRFDPILDVFRIEYEKQNNGTNDWSINLNPGHPCTSKNKRRVDDTSDLPNKLNSLKSKLKCMGRYIKLFLLICCWAIFSFSLVVTMDKEESTHLISVSHNKTSYLVVASEILDNEIGINVEGPFLSYADTNSYNDNITIWLDTIEKTNYLHRNGSESSKIISEIWILPLQPPELENTIPNQKLSKVFHLNSPSSPLKYKEISTVINLKTSRNSTVILNILYDTSPINAERGILYAASLLIGLYILLIFELVHSTIAAMMASTSSIAVLAALNQKPTMGEIVSWIDIDTILLLFSMMILVAIVADTGIFDYLAVFTYKISKGKVWSLLTILFIFTALLSAFLDNVTIILLMTPGIIRLCEVMHLNPVPVLTTVVIFSNIGGTMTPVGDPPNIIIASNKDVVDAGIEFGTFTLHMSIGVLIALFVVYGYIRIIFRNINSIRSEEPVEVKKLKQDILIWQKAAGDLYSFNEDENVIKETLMKKVKILEDQLEQKLSNRNSSPDQFEATLNQLEEKYPIRNKWLLAKSGFCMIIVIILFFMHSIPNFNISLGWTAFLCALLLLILSDSKDLDGLMVHIEWNTLLFFAALFVFMEALSKLGLITWIGEQTESVIMSVNPDSRLAVAILLLLWISAIAGALFDNVPLTTMMIKIVTGLAKNQVLQLPLQPLIWALAFGTCMGGNGTLIGATANVVCAGVAEKNGYRISFMQFLKIGLPVMLCSTLTVTVYLMISHVAFSWH